MNWNSGKKEIHNAISIVKVLSEINWLKKEPESLFHFISSSGKELYDLSLHKHDRSCTIPELYEFIENAGLSLVAFTTVSHKLALRIENYIQDFELLSRIQQIDIKKQQVIAELIVCNTNK